MEWIVAYDIYCFVVGKKPQLLVHILKTFQSWISESSMEKMSCIDNSIKLRALALMIRQNIIASNTVNMMAQCFGMDKCTNPKPFLVLLHQLLDRKEFIKVCWMVQCSNCQLLFISTLHIIVSLNCLQASSYVAGLKLHHFFTVNEVMWFFCYLDNLCHYLFII